MIRLMPGFSEKSRRPGVCSLTGNPQKHEVDGDPTSPLEPVVDLDTWIDHEGNLEITLQTAQEIGYVAGLVSPAQQEEVLELREKVSRLEAALSDKDDAIQVLASSVAETAHNNVSDREGEYARGYEQGCHDTEVELGIA